MYVYIHVYMKYICHLPFFPTYENFSLILSKRALFGRSRNWTITCIGVGAAIVSMNNTLPANPEDFIDACCRILDSLSAELMADGRNHYQPNLFYLDLPRPLSE
jgi:hypothetical protein